MVVSSVMTRDFYYVAPATPIATVAQAMRDFDVSCLPVITRRRLLGVVTDQDLLNRCLAESLDADTPVAQVMTNEVACCQAHHTVDVALEIMAAHGVRRLPVLDNGCVPVGFLSISDLAGIIPSATISRLLLSGLRETRYVAAEPDQREAQDGQAVTGLASA